MRDNYKQYTINGKTMYAHNTDEAFKKYKLQYGASHGDYLHINKKWYRVLGENIFQVLKKK